MNLSFLPTLPTPALFPAAVEMQSGAAAALPFIEWASDWFPLDLASLTGAALSSSRRGRDSPKSARRIARHVTH